MEMGKKILLVFLLLSSFLMEVNAQTVQWKAGVSRAVITPEGKMWLSGYGSRDRAAEGTLNDLWIKVLALEDGEGKRAILLTSDLVGFPKDLSDRIRERLRKQFNLSKAQIILNSSHTHSGPVLNDELHDYYGINFGAEDEKFIKAYSDKLEAKIMASIAEALQSMQSALVFTGNGVARFQVNRRNNAEAALSTVSELGGPNDYAVPVIKVADLSGRILSIVFGYACHATVLDGYQWSGDYPGFAQTELEKRYPGTSAMFFQGGGADLNPLPRRSVALARQYGKTLAAAVEAVLSDSMKRQPAVLKTAYTELDLPLSRPPTEEELKKVIASSSGYQLTWAKRILAELQETGSLIQSYPYPIQIWKIGEQPVFSLGGELVVAYTVELKRMYGPEVFVMGYNNDVMAYIPSSIILKEGGYEGARALMYFHHLASGWDPSVEIRILSGMEKLAEGIGLEKVQYPLWTKE